MNTNAALFPAKNQGVNSSAVSALTDLGKDEKNSDYWREKFTIFSGL